MRTRSSRCLREGAETAAGSVEALDAIRYVFGDRSIVITSDHSFAVIFSGGTKITMRIDSEDEMLALHERAKEMGILSSIVRDAGQTQVAPGSRTVIAIGPAPKSVLEKITGHLKLY